MAHLACIGEAISLYFSHILINIDLFKGSRKVNGVAEVCNIPVFNNKSRCPQENSCIVNLSVRLS